MTISPAAEADDFTLPSGWAVSLNEPPSTPEILLPEPTEPSADLPPWTENSTMGSPDGFVPVLGRVDAAD